MPRSEAATDGTDAPGSTAVALQSQASAAVCSPWQGPMVPREDTLSLPQAGAQSTHVCTVCHQAKEETVEHWYFSSKTGRRERSRCRVCKQAYARAVQANKRRCAGCLMLPHVRIQALRSL